MSVQPPPIMIMWRNARVHCEVAKDGTLRIETAGQCTYVARRGSPGERRKMPGVIVVSQPTDSEPPAPIYTSPQVALRRLQDLKREYPLVRALLDLRMDDPLVRALLGGYFATLGGVFATLMIGGPPTYFIIPVFFAAAGACLGFPDTCYKYVHGPALRALGLYPGP